MPFKKRRKNKYTKEKKAIATRLMVISLKMDDYIYKNKPISAQDAQMYIEELVTYKSKCINDVRSRQVIEKLTLFMKSIIKQNTLSKAPNDNPDIIIDITNTNNRLSTKFVNTITNSEDTIEKNTLKVCAVDNFASNEYKNQVYSCIDAQNNIDTDSFSNLSINPCKENLNKRAFDQTNLDAADGNNDELTKDNSIPILTEVTSMAVTACNINFNDLENANITLNDNVLKNNTDNNKEFIQDITIDHGDKVENNNGTENVTALSNICMVSLQHDNNDSSMIALKNTRDQIDVTTDKTNTKRKNKTVRIKKESKTKVTNKEKKRQRKQTNSKKNCEKVVKKNLNDNIGSSENSKCCNIEKEKVPDTVLDTDIIDLSWIKNIKYVREVCKDEYDLTLNNLEETFWNDLTLPVDWNFNDFDYSD